MLRCRCSVAHSPLVAPDQEPLPAVATVQASLGTTLGVPVLCGVIEGVHASLGSHIAVKMARDALMGEAVDAVSRPADPATGVALEVIRGVFREVNAKVYDYGHRMAAGGQVSAKGLIAVCDGERVSIGQAGEYESFLQRGGKIMPFFDRSGAAEIKKHGGVLDRFIGANAKILVDLASVAVREGDFVIVTTLAPGTGAQQIIEKALRQSSSADEACREIVRTSCKKADTNEVLTAPERFKTATCFLWQIEGAAR